MQRITRDRHLTPEEVARYRAVRQQVAAELPELVARHHERVAAAGIPGVIARLHAAREAQGLSLAELTARTGVDELTLSGLESGLRPDPTVETLARYAEAVGKRLVVTLADG